MSDYAQFLASKSHISDGFGFEPIWIPDFLMDFQKNLVDWQVRIGRGAMFANCGLGKTPMEFVWAFNVVMHTNKNVLILTTTAVASQMIREAEKFGINDVGISRDGKPAGKITIANYEKLHLFDRNDYIGCACDESSILKNFAGKRKTEITEFIKRMPYRLLATATASPNDYTELGTSSEALGYLGHMDMLNKFFKNDLNNSASGRMRGEVIKWRFKGHAELPFWRWVCSWARAIRKPSDLGFDDGGFVLPPAVERLHVVEAKTLAPGMLFALPAAGLGEQREERRRTIQERCEKVSDLVKHGRPALVWCHMNEEGDLLEKLIPDAIQVKGSQSEDEKEEKLLAFADNKERVLITKPKIGAWGLNFQHCADMTFFPSHSYEQYYQCVHRCLRFGQKNTVNIDVVATEGEMDVLKNLQAKQAKSDRMFANLVAEMNNAMNIQKQSIHTMTQKVPSWL